MQDHVREHPFLHGVFVVLIEGKGFEDPLTPNLVEYQTNRLDSYIPCFSDNDGDTDIIGGVMRWAGAIIIFQPVRVSNGTIGGSHIMKEGWNQNIDSNHGAESPYKASVLVQQVLAYLHTRLLPLLMESASPLSEVSEE